MWLVEKMGNDTYEMRGHLVPDTVDGMQLDCGYIEVELPDEKLNSKILRLPIQTFTVNDRGVKFDQECVVCTTFTLDAAYNHLTREGLRARAGRLYAQTLRN